MNVFTSDDDSNQATMSQNHFRIFTGIAFRAILNEEKSIRISEPNFVWSPSLLSDPHSWGLWVAHKNQFIFQYKDSTTKNI